jgi:uncharacterized protein (DUF1697 family)
MAQHRFVALLRGINVGGNNLIKMADLRAAFASLGYDDVATYIASGNVVFSSSAAGTPRHTKAIEAALTATFGCGTPVVVVTAAELARVVAEAPAGFGTDPARHRYDVLFVRAPMTAAAALPDVPAKPGVDTVVAGAHALYYRRLVARASQSHLPRLMARPLYKLLTIRNWNTTAKLRELATAAAG